MIHHEYGHHLINMAGSGQGQYGEGMGDVIANLLSEDPGIGYGFLGDCAIPNRTAISTIQYPCNDQIHACGVLLSACIWDLKNELSVRYPTNYLDTLANLTINSILLHYGTKIDSQIAIDFLVLDDDDSDLENGTPHSTEILAAFGAHNLGYSAPNAIWVDSATGDNETGDGSENSPYASIQKGIDAAYSGDTVYVGPGTYTELVNFHGKPIPVLSTQGPLFTRITGGPSANLVNFNSNEDSTSIFEGFTIEGGSIGIKIRHSGPTIRGNVLIGQLSAGIDVYDDLVTDINELPNIHNNTIVYGASSGIVVYTLPGFPLNFKNNIVAFCGGAGISLFDPPWSEISSEQPLVTYNDVYGNNPDYDLVTPGTGSISSDPLFCDLSRLSVLSPRETPIRLTTTLMVREMI